MSSQKQLPLADGSHALASAAERERRRHALLEPHVAPLTAFVRRLRRARPGDRVPFFDPRDGGVHAEVLLLMEAPGPKAVHTGFVSRDNPDPTARNLRRFLEDAGIARERTALWNVVPWYLGTGKRIRAATGTDVKEGGAYLERLLPLFTRLRGVVLVGRKAQSARAAVERLSRARIFETLHPSNQLVACFPHRVGEIESALAELAAFLRTGMH